MFKFKNKHYKRTSAMNVLKDKKAHFIGIGGIGMSSLAMFLVKMGIKVTGSDAKMNNNINQLKLTGIKVYIGHKAEHINNADLVVYSSAIKPDNIEFLQSKSQGIPLYKRGKVLGDLANLYNSISVVGSHGKTTTTSIIGEILTHVDFDPSVIVGGIMNQWSSSYRVGKSDIMVLEADESDNSMLEIMPNIVVLTNLEADHLEFHLNYDNLQKSFLSFIKQIPIYGKVIFCANDKNSCEIINQAEVVSSISYGIEASTEYNIPKAELSKVNYLAKNIKFTKYGVNFSVAVKKGDFNYILENITVNGLYGLHNVLNITAAIAAAHEVEASPSGIIDSLKHYKGVQKRFSKVGSYKNTEIIDDYAHHPSAIKATLQSAKQIVKDLKNGKVMVVLQPHKYSRVRDFFQDFTSSLTAADYIILLEVFSAGEPKIEGATSDDLLHALQISGHHNVHLVKDTNNLANHIFKIIDAFDLVLFMGAGDITEIARTMSNQLKQLEVVGLNGPQ